ncbi:MAG: Wzz/FepE/Etk N-terminal domain-containing protein [Thiohalocapsa sp.]
MEEPLLTIEDYLAILKRRKWQLILPIVLLAPIAVVVALTLPPVYRSTATILIEQQEIPADLIRTTVTSFADQRIQVIKQRVMTTKNLGEIIQKYDLYPGIRRKVSLNAAVAEMRRNVGLDMISADVVDPRSGSSKQATIAFSLSYESPSAGLAQKVTNELLSLFLNENLRQREAAVEEASAFLRDEAERLADQIRELEASLSEFKQAHGDNLPELLATNRELMARAEQQMRDNALSLRMLEEQELYLESELDQLDPRLVVATSGDPQGAVSPQARLQALETQYVGIAARYASTHPDRMQMEREISALRKEVGRSGAAELRRQRADLLRELGAARERYSAKHPDVQRLERNLAQVDSQIANAGRGGGDEPQALPPQNPAFVQLESRLEAKKLDRQMLLESQQALNERIQVYEQRLLEAPNIEREYRSLTLGYENTLSKYREVKDKQLEAELAQALESERKAERFTLIEPPVVADEPVKPNRPAIMMLGMVLSVGAGAGHLALRELLDKGLRGAKAVLAITGAPPLAVIPYIGVPEDRRRRVRKRAVLAGAAAVCAVAGVAAVHFFFMPLDLLWFTLLRRIEDYLPTASLFRTLGLIRWTA